MIIGPQALETIRRHYGMSQAAFAALPGVSLRTYNRLRHRRARLPEARKHAIAARLDATIWHIAELHPEPVPEYSERAFAAIARQRLHQREARHHALGGDSGQISLYAAESALDQLDELLQHSRRTDNLALDVRYFRAVDQALAQVAEVRSSVEGLLELVEEAESDAMERR
jgi:transcriptional regulator with XRE-family HTH domain